MAGIQRNDAGRLEKAASMAFKIVHASGKHGDITLELDCKLSFPAAARDDVKDQGYKLEIRPEGIHAVAHDARGLYYALQTLRQIPQTAAGMPACSICDWPDLPLRIFHIPGDRNMPRYDELLKLMDLLAGYKYNMFVMHYRDRFSFERYPVLNHPSAFSNDQIRNLIVYAGERFITLIPRLDTLGHTDCYLRHKQFQHLAELPGNPRELCPSNPETLTFIKSLWEEVLEVHKDAKIAHIGGDEVFRLGSFCPRCDRQARTGTLARLYTDYYHALGTWFVEQGIRPIMANDIILMHPEALKRLPRATIFCDWHYAGDVVNPGARVFIRGAGEYRPGEESLIPERYSCVFGKYLRATDGNAPFEHFPFLRYLKEQGYDVLAQTMANAMLPNSGGFRDRISNNRLFSITARKVQALGLFNSTWESYLPVHNSLHGIAAGGNYAWNSQDVAEDAFMERFARGVEGNSKDLPRAAAVMERLFVEVREFNPTPAPGDHAVLRAAAKSMTENAATNPDSIPGLYAELTALRVEMAARAAAIQETKVLATRMEIGTGSDITVDISGHVNWDGVMPKRSGIIDPAQGRHVLHGIPFEIPAVNRKTGARAICVGGKISLVGREHGAAVRLPIQQKCDMLFFLVAGAWGRLNSVDGVFRMHFADGRNDALPLIVGKNINDWSGGNQQGHAAEMNGLLTGCVSAWEGGKAEDGGLGIRIRIYLCWWKNPRPESLIEYIDFLPNEENTGFAALFGLTARAAGTTRAPDDAPQIRVCAADLRRAMLEMAMEDEALTARHRLMYDKLLAPEDAASNMQKLIIPDLHRAIKQCDAIIADP
jgi:hypothetical protein